MKNNILIPVLFIFIHYFNVNAQINNEIEVNTTVSDVTVFLKGAQVTRKTQVSFPAGNSTIRFDNLSPYIDAKSVQVKVDGEIMVLSVNHSLNYNNTVKLNEEITEFVKQLEVLDEKIRLEQINLTIVSEKIDFLRSNKAISGSERGIEHINLQLTTEYYSQQITTLLTSQAEINQKISLLSEEKTAIQRKMATAGNVNPEPTGEIILTVNARTAIRVPVELSYYVENASWFPSYDIRAKDITQPIELVYKANVMQNTREEWNNVALKISSANPNLGNIAPQLKTYFLDYNTAPPRYDLTNSNLSNTVSGIVSDQTGNPLPGVSVFIRGTSIGTITQIDGRYSLAIPAGGGELVFSYIGFHQQTRAINNSIINVVLEEDTQQLEEVVVVALATQRRAMFTGARSTDSAESQTIPIPVTQVENTTSFEFEISIPYSIPSESKVTVVEMEHYSLPAEYEYYAVPKADKDAFLLANIVEWEQYNLLEGEANIFFENTFVGKTILDVRYLSDTLSVSLGRDKNVFVRREQVKETTQTRFLSSRTEITRNWRITVRNNKGQPISMVLFDQIPISTLSEIEVTGDILSNGVLNKETGEVHWRFALDPTQRAEFELLYRVRYPRGRNLTVE